MSSEHHQVTSNINSFNPLTSEFHNRIVNWLTVIDTEQQILKWLSPLEPQQRHQCVRTERLDGVGNWVLETNEFRKWRDMEDGSAEPALFCYGNPGVGKTYLTSLVIESLCNQAQGKDIPITGLYCDFLTQQEQSTANMLGAILKQLINRGEIPEHIREAFRKAKKEFGGQGLRLSDMVETLKKTIAQLPGVFICIDALDEPAPKHRRELLESLREIVRVSPNTRIFITGRPYVNDEIVRYFGKAARMPVSPSQGDIKSYLEMRLGGDPDPDAMDDELRADIMRIIPEKISEIFLLVSLSTDAVLGEITLHQRRKKLDEITKGEGLGDAYAATLARVKAQPRSKSKLGMEFLMWVSHSQRPLHVDELCHALGVEKGSTDLNIRNIPTVKTLLACTLGLVTVEESTSTFHLVHYTLQEHLYYNRDLFLKPHSMIAEVCLTYLNFRHVRSFSPTLRSVPPSIPFVKYSSCHWGTHARRETTEGVKTLALKLLDGYDKHISSKMLLLDGVDDRDQPFDQEDTPKGFTGLHCASYLGCGEITAALFETGKWDVQATDLNGNTAVAWAARRGNEGVLWILLQWSGATSEKADNCSRTPLWWAARNGYEGVVEVLLSLYGANPNTADTEHGRTPLLWAAENGHEGIVKMLLKQCTTDPNRADTEHGRTPLSLAAENGHERIVEMLLRRNNIYPNIADTEHGRTPLLWATKNGHEGIVKMLLKRHTTDPNIADTEHGRTPFSWAAQNGHERVVIMLLKRDDVDPDRADMYGRTPLSWAAENGHEGVVKILLERDDVNPDTPDGKYGRTPLSWAAKNGHKGVVTILLERTAVDPNTADDEDGRALISVGC